MTIRFAAPPTALAPRMSARRIRETCGLPANDNGVLLIASLTWLAPPQNPSG